MTTIVYDHERNQIACDSRLNADGVVLTDKAVKWKKKDDGSVWFFTGNPADDERLMSLNHDDKPEVKPNSNAIYAKDGCAYLVTFDGDYCAHTKLEYNHSIGSGWKFALAALDFSLETEEAVKYASQKDCFTGGEVLLFCVKSGSFK